MTERWDRDKQEAVKKAIDKTAKLMANRLGAESCLVIGFFRDPVDPEVIHMTTGGQSPYPPFVLFDRLAQLNRGSEQDEILKDRHRSKTTSRSLRHRG